MAEETEPRWAVRYRVAVHRTDLARAPAELRSPGAHARAAIAARTGLPKATGSSLVAELMRRWLIRRNRQRQEDPVGGPGRLLKFDSGAVAALGQAVNANALPVRVVELARRPLVERRIVLDAISADAEAGIAEPAVLTRSVVAELDEAERTRISVAIHGAVDIARGVVVHVAPLRWHDVPIADLPRVRIGLPENLLTTSDNESNLPAPAELRAEKRDRPRDLVSVTGQTDVGIGVLSIFDPGRSLDPHRCFVPRERVQSRGHRPRRVLRHGRRLRHTRGHARVAGRYERAHRARLSPLRVHGVAPSFLIKHGDEEERS